MVSLIAGGQWSLADADDADDADDVVAIVHPENPSLTLAVHDLRLMYGLYRRVWSSGDLVRIVQPLPDSPAMDFLIQRVFRRMKSATDIDRFYLEALFQQRIGRRPEVLSPQETIFFVQSVPGAVALVERSALRAPLTVRVLEVGGIGP